MSTVLASMYVVWNWFWSHKMKNRRVIIKKHVYMLLSIRSALQWRHNGRDGVSNHRRLDCLLSHWFRRRSKNTSKPPSQRASNAEKCFHLMTSLWYTTGVRHFHQTGFNNACVACSAWSHYLNQCMLIVNQTLSDNFVEIWISLQDISFMKMH